MIFLVEVVKNFIIVCWNIKMYGNNSKKIFVKFEHLVFQLYFLTWLFWTFFKRRCSVLYCVSVVSTYKIQTFIYSKYSENWRLEMKWYNKLTDKIICKNV